jgi:HK97 gp10 family phage protein
MSGESAMSVEVDYNGLDEMFKRLAFQTENGAKKASVVGAEIVAEKLKENTPYEEDRKGDGKWKAQRQMEKETGVSQEFKHMRDDIIMTNPNPLGEIEVKYGKATAWRSRFVNDGTIKQPAQHFAEKTVAETYEEVKIAMQRVIEREVEGI